MLHFGASNKAPQQGYLIIFLQIHGLKLGPSALLASKTSTWLHRAQTLAVAMHTLPVCLIGILTTIHFQGICAGAQFTHTSRNRPLSIARLGRPYATCTPVEPILPPMTRFDVDCLGAWEGLLLLGEEFIEKNWKWSRFPEDRAVPEGFQPLPFEQEHNSCAIKIDILGKEDTVDHLVLFNLGVPMRHLYFECITIGRGRITAGYIPVGTEKRLKLSVGPVDTRRDNASRPASNLTLKSPSEHR